jgi:hypothetical protein
MKIITRFFKWILQMNIMIRCIFYTFALLNRRLYNPEIAFGDFSDIKGDLSVAK